MQFRDDGNGRFTLIATTDEDRLTLRRYAGQARVNKLVGSTGSLHIESITLKDDENTQDREDAERWRALLSSAMIAKKAAPLCKAAPSPSAEDCSYHWLHSERSMEPSIAQWVKGAGPGQVGAWLGIGEGGTISPAEMERRGWEYLGPVDGASRPRSKYLDDPEPAYLDGCGCRRCDTARKKAANIPIRTARFIVCETCGHKRCPHATDHRHACTGSNEPGQPGSDYE